MMKMKWLVGLIGIASLAPISALAGLNPADPGLPSASYKDAAGTTVKAGMTKNSFSSMCVDCHTLNPYPGSPRPGSHFVSTSPDAAGLLQTNSGGGWGTALSDSYSGPRNNGAYFRISSWPSGAYSKYGNLSNDNSVSGTSTGNHTGLVDNTAANYNVHEIICESCHNILVNAAGGNNLVGDPLAQNMANAESTAATVYNVCVGCHGDMYAENALNADAGYANATKYGWARNNNEVGGGKRGNNTLHTIDGGVTQMNHHVTTGDIVNGIDNNGTLQGAGLNWRDTKKLALALNPVQNTTRALSQMPSKTTWGGVAPHVDATKVKPATAVNCLNCHTAGHGGNALTAASILRETGGTTAPIFRATAPAGNGIARLGEQGRAWLDFDDTLYCNDCHELGAAR